MSRVWGGTAFAKRSNESPSGAFKRQRGLRQQMEGRCPDKRYPNKITSKLARVAEVKSRMDRKFSRIENLWPRDGSCPLPLRSKRIFNKCFRIVKTQKISRGTLLIYVGHRLLRTKFLPLFCSGVDGKSVSRSVGSCNFQGSGMKNCRPVARLQILSGNKENRPAKDQRILSEESGGKMVRCGCGAAV